MPARLHAVGVVVRDMPAALAFYRLLGLDIDAAEDGSPHVEHEGPDGLALGFVTEAMTREADPKWQDRRGDRVNLQFRLDAPADVDAAHARLAAAGHDSYQEPWDAFWGQRFARVVDPDGNVVNLFCPLP